jgi:hypothetical protein
LPELRTGQPVLEIGHSGDVKFSSLPTELPSGLAGVLPEFSGPLHDVSRAFHH